MDYKLDKLANIIFEIYSDLNNVYRCHVHLPCFVMLLYWLVSSEQLKEKFYLNYKKERNTGESCQ